MKTLFYIFRRYTTASLLNLLGLVVAYSVCYVMLTQVFYQQSYNKCLNEWENLYRVEEISQVDARWGSWMCRPWADVIAKTVGVESMALFSVNNSVCFDKDGSTISMPLACMTGDMLEAIRAVRLSGSLVTHQGQEGFVIPASLAEKYFGSVDVAGRMMKIKGGEGKEVAVIGVYEDFAANCNFRNCCFYDIGDENENEIGMFSYDCYVRLVPEANRDDVERQIAENVRQNYREWFEKGTEMTPQIEQYINDVQVRITRVDETYFSGVNPWDDKGSHSMYIVLQLACVLVILIAAINFSNFTLAETPVRIKSINTRKVLGSSDAALRLGMIGEGLLISCVALLLAGVVVSQLAMWSAVSEMLQGSVAVVDNWLASLILFVVAVVVGLVTSVYPAFYATSFAPALVLKGSFGLSPKGRLLRTTLIFIQFFISFCIMSYLFVLNRQSDYLYTSDYGYDKDQVIRGRIYSKIPLGEAESLRQEILKVPGVENVSYSQQEMGTSDVGYSWSRGNEERSYSMRVFSVDRYFLDTYGINVLEGRDFNEHDRCVFVINEAMKRNYPELEMDKRLFDGCDITVVGVCEDIRFGTARQDNHNISCAFSVTTGNVEEDGLHCINVRIGKGADYLNVRKDVEEAMRQFTNDLPQLEFVDESLEMVYRDEFRFMKQIKCFAAIAMIITLIGVFCLTMFEAEYRRREIGIRKVMGASNVEVLRLFTRQYLWLLVAGFVPSVPVAYCLSESWLENFVERTDVGFGGFVYSFLIISAVTLVIVVVKSYSAAAENPVESVKN